MINNFQIIPQTTEKEIGLRAPGTTPQPLDFPTTIVSDPLLSHFSQELDNGCSGPLQSLRSSIDSLPQQIISKFRGKSNRSRSGSDSSSSTGLTEITRQKSEDSCQSNFTITSQPDLQEQYLHLGGAAS